MNQVPLAHIRAQRIQPNSSEARVQIRPCEAPAPLFERVIDNTFTFKREGRAAQISQVVEATLICLLLCTVIGGLLLIGSCYALDRGSPSIAHTAIDYEYGVRRGAIPFSPSSWINKRTVMKGANRTWDEQRIIGGKLALYKRMGAESVRLNTRTGDQIHGCYFDAASFNRKLEECQGTIVRLSLAPHPFLEATPVTLRSTSSSIKSDGVQISTQAARDPEFQQFCEENEFCIVQASEFAEYQDGERYLLVSKSSFAKRAYADCKIVSTPAPSFGWEFKLFAPSYRQTGVACVFDQQADLDGIQDLQKFGGLCKRSLGDEQILASANTCRAIDGIKRQQRAYRFLQLQRTDLSESREQLNQGVICLSPHQTSSIYSMYRQIFAQLSRGLNVFVYDQAGKGLSQGHCTQRGMTESVRSAGEFLQEVKRFQEEQIIFTAQCSAALPVSEGAKLFPNAHFWIDQAPRHYAGMTKCSLARKLDLDENGYLAGLVGSLAASFLPTYDVIENLRQGEGGGGLRIYTIGVADERGQGGDRVVPEVERDQFESYLDRCEHGHYLTMPGASHVQNNVWNYPAFRIMHELFRERLSPE